MTITRRPPRPAKPPPAVKQTPEAFIDSAHHPTASETVEPPAEMDAKKSDKKKTKEKDKAREKEKGKDRKKRRDKEAVLFRFDDGQLAMMDAQASALGLSRTAWMRMVVAKALKKKKR